MKLTRPEGKHQKGRNYWQWAKHEQLYSYLLQALKGEPVGTLSSQQSRPNFCVRSTPLRGHKPMGKGDKQVKNTSRKNPEKPKTRVMT